MDGLDQSCVIEIPKELVILLAGGEIGFVNEMLGEVNLVEGKVIAEDEVE